MGKLGERIISDTARAKQLKRAADRLEAQAAIMRREADEIYRLLELARLEIPSR